MNSTLIEWADSTLNVMTGCTKISTGCALCYAEELHTKRHTAHLNNRHYSAPVQYHKPFSEIQLFPDRLAIPKRTRTPKRIFLCSMGDLFHPDVPDSFLHNVCTMIEECPQHTFMMLTKRPRRMASFFLYRRDSQAILPNLWLGTTVENQAAADARLHFLTVAPAAKRFISVEPMLGPVNLTYPLYRQRGGDAGLDWVICGPETGSGRREFVEEWALDLRDQCHSVGVPFFWKGKDPLNGKEYREVPV